MNFIALIFSSTFFTGFLPGKLIGKEGKGGGLAGSVVALLIQLYFVYADFGFKENLILIISSLFLGLITVTPGEKYISKKWGILNRHNGEMVNYDYNQTNIDEVHGQAISGMSAFMFNITPIGRVIFLFISFLWFRLFDTKKTWPIKGIEKKIKGAFGIMFDDTIAGVMALIVTILFLVYLPLITSLLLLKLL